MVGVPDPKWDERPLLVVVPKPAASPGDARLEADILAFMGAHPDVAKFAVPDGVLFVEAIPYGATGKARRGERDGACWGPGEGGRSTDFAGGLWRVVRRPHWSGPEEGTLRPTAQYSSNPHPYRQIGPAEQPTATNRNQINQALGHRNADLQGCAPPNGGSDQRRYPEAAPAGAQQALKGLLHGEPRALAEP